MFPSTVVPSPNTLIEFASLEPDMLFFLFDNIIFLILKGDIIGWVESVSVLPKFKVKMWTGS